MDEEEHKTQNTFLQLDDRTDINSIHY